MAASALVAVPDPAASRPASVAPAIDPASFTAVSIALPVRATATSNRNTDSAQDTVSTTGSNSAFLEPGIVVAPSTRPRVRTPSARVSTIAKNYWRFDPETSWYGPGFYGSGTACGQAYDKEILGVAHRTLPCGTLVTFRNPQNGREITVPVIDRGPYVAGRQWDLSRALCEYLDHCWTGPIEWRWGH
jgi:rare lipoprotein A